LVYVTDVVATDGKVKAIELPAELQPSVEYGAAVVKGAKQPAAAKEFIDGLLAGKGLKTMHDAGFEPPPK
jgi:molybdate transport system substrate-binding protein